MREDKRDAGLTVYVVRYYGHFMDRKERFALGHLRATMKATHGRSDLTAQQEARSSKAHLHELLSEDPEVLRLANAGMAAFQEQTVTRILAELGDKLILNRCLKCGAKRPAFLRAQCRSCHHDWHNATE